MVGIGRAPDDVAADRGKTFDVHCGRTRTVRVLHFRRFKVNERTNDRMSVPLLILVDETFGALRRDEGWVWR